jgi:hypothetical protein
LTNAECDDGAYCNGLESCDPTTEACRPGQSPDCDDGVFCKGAESCDLAADQCEPGSPPTCDDGIACTMDSCDASLDECVNSPSNAVCDDGLFCNGVETCDAATGCQPGAPPCMGSVPVDGATVFLECDEATDTCVVPPIPTVSTWGLITLAQVILTVAKLRRGPAPESPRC